MSSSYYCIWGLCDSRQYCCGDNVCCDETDFNMLLVTIIFGIIIVMTFCCICFYCISRRIYTSFLKKYFKIIYILTQKEFKEKEWEDKFTYIGNPVFDDVIVKFRN